MVRVDLWLDCPTRSTAAYRPRTRTWGCGIWPAGGGEDGRRWSRCKSAQRRNLLIEKSCVLTMEEILTKRMQYCNCNHYATWLITTSTKNNLKIYDYPTPLDVWSHSVLPGIREEGDPGIPGGRTGRSPCRIRGNCCKSLDRSCSLKISILQ